MLLQLVTWMNRVETHLRRPSSSLSIPELHRKSDLLLRSLGLACAMRNAAVGAANLHGKLSVPMSR